MRAVDLIPYSRRHASAFTLVELLVVIAIMSILMAAGAIGLGGMGGKGVTSGVATAESLFDEARSLAIGKRTYARVMVAKELTNSPADNLRRMIIITAKPDSKGSVITPVAPSNWDISSRGAMLSDQSYFSQNFSKKNQAASNGELYEMNLTTDKVAYKGKYYFFEFNPEGICTIPNDDPSFGRPLPPDEKYGARFVIGAGSRGVNKPTDKPRVTSSGKSDFGGFVVWRNGRTSVFRSPAQIASGIDSLNPGATF